MVMIVWDEDESFCLVPHIEVEERYVYSWVYNTISLEEDKFALVGCIVCSVEGKDKFVYQFFNDDAITDYFANRITLFMDEIDTNWLLSYSLMDSRIEPIFIAEPFMIKGESAEDLCNLLFTASKERGFVIKDPNIGDLHKV